MERCRYVYDPTGANTSFTVYFDQDATAEQHKRATSVIQHLQSLDRELLVDESVQFFRWLVHRHVSSDNLEYAQRLLDFFHSEKLLVHKRSAQNPLKQLKPRMWLASLSGSTHSHERTTASEC